MIEVGSVGEPENLAPGQSLRGSAPEARWWAPTSQRCPGRPDASTREAVDSMLPIRLDQPTDEQWREGAGVVSVLSPIAPMLAPSRGTDRWAAFNEFPRLPKAMARTVGDLSSLDAPR